jgi:RNA polymerase sigma-70 factor (ECF subfamily)
LNTVMNAYTGFDGWYQEEWSRLVATLAVVDGDMEAARDSAAEAFARALSNWSRVATMERRTGWLYRVGFNVQRRRLRRASLEQRLLARSGSADAAGPLWGGLADPTFELHRAVAALPRRQRMAVVLTYFADLPQAEVAEAMGVHRGTVASSLSAARSNLALTLALKEIPS